MKMKHYNAMIKVRFSHTRYETKNEQADGASAALSTCPLFQRIK